MERKTDQYAARALLNSGAWQAGMMAIFLLGCVSHALAGDTPLPVVLAKRGKLIVDDTGVKDRGGKTIIELGNGAGVKAALGTWQRAEPRSNVWRSTWTKGMRHPPVAAYHGVKTRDLIVEVTFRYGEATERWHQQFLRIAADQRPQLKGHIVSAWVNPKGPYTKNGLVLEHVGKLDEKTGNRGLLMDHQPVTTKPGAWYTATLEIVDDEALFRVGNHVAYAKAQQIRMPKNLVSLTLGTTWHEIKRVRIWHATLNPKWEAQKDDILQPRKSFATQPR